jgi:hypothetical protein
MIASPSGTNFYSPDVVPDATTAEDQFAVCHKLEVRIALDMYIEKDGFYWPPTTVQSKTCGSDSKDGWAGKYANGGKTETSTSIPVPYATRNPVNTPLLPRE